MLNFHTLDVFTATRFGGNPLAVVLGADSLTPAEMQTITREFNLAETIFVMAPKDPANTAAVRIFMPTAEIPFAGHPTIGCAILLAESLMPQGPFTTEIRLEEVAGLVPVTVRRGSSGPTWAQFTAPVLPFPVDIPLQSNTVAAALGLSPDEIGPLGLHQGGPRFLYVPLTTRDALSRARAHEPAWSTLLHSLNAVGGYLYTKGGDHPETAFRARMLNAAGEGAEDPATGSATALLASHLLAQGLPDGKHSFDIEQGFEMGRPSRLNLQADVRQGRLTEVRVAGTAVHVMHGQLSV